MRRIVYLIIFQVLIFRFASASQVIILTDSLQELCISRGYVDYFEDSTAQLNITDIVSRSHVNFKTSTANDLTNSNNKSAYWLRFKLLDRRKSEHPFRIELFDFDIDQISFYFPDKTGRYKESVAGFSYPFSHRELDHKNVSFIIPLESKNPVTVYMRFFSHKTNVLEPIIRSYNKTVSYGFTEYLLFGVFYGLFLLMIFYNTLYYFILRKKYSVFYVFYALGILTYLVSQDGTGFQYLWPRLPEMNPYIGNIGLLIGIESMLAFTISFLHIRKYSKNILYLLLSAMVGRMIFFIVNLIVPVPLASGIVDVLLFQVACISGVNMLTSGRRTRSSIWFIIAFSVLNIGFIVTWLEHVGIISSGVLSVYSLNIGVIIQFVLLSVGIAESVKETYRLKNEAQTNLIIELERNEAMKAKANQELEIKVKERTVQLEQQKDLVEDKNTQIMDSVMAAKNIQTAILPSKEVLKGILNDYFILYMPRDIVSGDFYWAHSINEDEYLIAAVDCTGHGVPGAFMSMIGINLLNRIVSEGIYMPDQILLALHRNVQKVLDQESSKNTDGMDMALCYVNKKEKKVYYSGAKNPMVYIQDGNISKVAASKFPIGGKDQTPDVKFDLHTVSFGDSPVWFYLFTDGYRDQFGGPKNKKFLLKNLMDLIHQNHSHVPEKQRTTLKSTLKDWMGEEAMQIDDVLVMGICES